MPTPVAHTLAGASIAALAAQRRPAARSLPVVSALLFAANLPDCDYLSVLGGREALERFHQGPFHSLGFVALATVPLALLLRRRIGLAPAWLLLAGAGLTHLLLDLVVVDRWPPIGFPFFWPFTAKLFHSSLDIFPGIDRVSFLSLRNLRELLAELAWCLPIFLATLWPLVRGRSR